MLHVEQLREEIIRPALQLLDRWSEAAENLLLGTCAQESRLGTYVKQIKGPALGIYQMEPATHHDLWQHYLKYREELAEPIRQGLGGLKPTEDMLIYNLRYATQMARVHYQRVPEKLPNARDVPGLALYWKEYYNTGLGKGTPAEFEHNYQTLVLNRS